MKICYLCADRGIRLEKHNGATSHFRSLVGAFRQLGHEMLVLNPGGDTNGTLGVPVRRLETPVTLDTLMADVEAPVPRDQRAEQRRRKRVVHALGHAWDNMVVERTLTEAIADFRPDLVFELYSPFGVAGCIVANRMQVPHVLNVHAPLAWEGATFRNQALQEAAELLEDAALSNARRIVTNSVEMRDYLIAAGVSSEKLNVVVNGVDTDRFHPDGPVNRPVGDNEIVVGFCGSLKAWHGMDVLIEAFRQVAENPRFHLLVVGDGPLSKDVRQLADELPGRITMTGAIPLEEVPAWLRAMDIAVAPYPPMDPFYFSPLKVLEYMAVGSACIASAIGQNGELIDDGQTGLLTPPGDAGALAAAILRLGEDEALRNRVSMAAAKVAREQHGWQQRARNILDVAMAHSQGQA